MNNSRRRDIKDMMKKIEKALDEVLDINIDFIRDIQYDEEEYMDNIPYNLMGSVRYYKAQDAIDNLSQAYELLDEVVCTFEDSINDVLEYLDYARE